MTQAGKPTRLPGLDGLRAISVILVIVSHQYGGSSQITAFDKMGGLGVEVFFVLSGYLITYLLIQEERVRGSISLTNFYARRILRIFPPLVFYLLLLFAANVSGIVNIPKIDFLSCFFFFRNLVGSSWETSHFWSLAIEEQFYLFWPIIFTFFKSKKTRIIIVTSIVFLCPLWRQMNYIVAGGAANLNGRRADMMLSPIAIGCLLALLSSSHRSRLILSHPYLRSGLMAAMAIALIWLANLSTLYNVRFIRAFAQTISSIGIATIINLTTQGARSAWTTALEMPALAWIGRLSYSLYLWQQPFINYGHHNLDKYYQILPLNIFIITFFAVFSYYIIELPLLSIRRRLSWNA